MDHISLALGPLLPDVLEVSDGCVGRLRASLADVPGVRGVELRGGPQADNAYLGVRFDPAVVSLDGVEQQARTAGAELHRRYGHATFSFGAVGAEHMAREAEEIALRVAGVTAASVHQAARLLRVEFDRFATDGVQIAASLERAGYPRCDRRRAARSSGERPDGHAHRSAPRSPHKAGCRDCGHDDGHRSDGSLIARNKELVLSLCAGAVLLVAWAGARFFGLPHAFAVGLCALSYAFGGYDLVSHTVASIRRGRLTFDIDLLMLLAAAGAALLGEWTEGAFLLFLFSLAHALEHYALGRTRNAIKALADLAPPTARLVRDGREQDVPVEAVRLGEVAVVRPGERIPIDGIVRSGRSSVNQAPVTGESVPVEKVPGSEVFAGTVNGDGALEVDTTRAAGDRTLDRVIHLVQEAQTHKAPTQEFTDRFERWFVPTVLVADFLLIVVPPLAGLWPWDVSFYRGMALLVAASPCALALGTPATVLAAVAQAARHGVLIKGGAHLENLGRVRAFALDKTGTLTAGRPEVTDVVPADAVGELELLRVAAAVERRSQHPLARAVVRRAEADRIDPPPAAELESLTARGVRSSVEGRTVEVGSLRLWEQDGAEVPVSIRKTVRDLQLAGRSVMVVRNGDRFLGTLGVADEPRPGVDRVLRRLRAAGIERLVMLTGDNRGVGEAVGRQCGVDEVRADLLPEGKVEAVRELLARYGRIAMVGDGVNDAPALANATVGIAMGGSGTAVALETADVALMGDDLGKLVFAVRLSRRARAVIRQNLILSLGVIALLIVSSTTGLSGIGLTVLVHEGSTLVVIANALRLLAVRDDAPAALPTLVST